MIRTHNSNRLSGGLPLASRFLFCAWAVAGDLSHSLSCHTVLQTLSVDGQGINYMCEKMYVLWWKNEKKMSFTRYMFKNMTWTVCFFQSFFFLLLEAAHVEALCQHFFLNNTGCDGHPLLILNTKEALIGQREVLGLLPLGRANSQQDFGVKWYGFHHPPLPFCTLCDRKNSMLLCSFFWFNKWSWRQCGVVLTHVDFGLRVPGLECWSCHLLAV